MKHNYQITKNVGNVIYHSLQKLLQITFVKVIIVMTQVQKLQPNTMSINVQFVRIEIPFLQRLPLFICILKYI